MENISIKNKCQNMEVVNYFTNLPFPIFTKNFFPIFYQLWKTSQTKAAVYLPKYTKSIEAALWECQRVGTRTEPLLEAGHTIIINTIILYQIKIKK